MSKMTDEHLTTSIYLWYRISKCGFLFLGDVTLAS